MSVEARKVAITPTQKVYILNGREVLAGHYQVTERTVDLDRNPIEIYDMLGVEGMLFRHAVVDDDQVTRGYVEQTQQWFDSLWNTIARPMDPNRTEPSGPAVGRGARAAGGGSAAAVQAAAISRSTTSTAATHTRFVRGPAGTGPGSGDRAPPPFASSTPRTSTSRPDGPSRDTTPAFDSSSRTIRTRVSSPMEHLLR